MDKSERNQLIEIYKTSFSEFETALDKIPQEMWTFKPEPKEWSVHEIIVHLADSETNSYIRARRLIADPGEMLMAYDQDHWAIALDYHSQDWQIALETSRLVRQSSYELIKDLPENVWAHSAKHPEHDENFQFEQWLRIYAKPPLAHRDQVLANHSIWKNQHA